MNILFLTMSRIFDLEQKGIYPDLLREFVKNSHNVTIAAPAERYLKEDTNFKKYDGYSVLRVKIGNMQKTNVIEKGITTITLESKFLSAIKKYCGDTKFDLVLYSTPPITFSNVISYIKKRDGAKSYLLLKDIFPQNAVDLNMFSDTSLFYKFFRKKEKRLYEISDRIGCMSQANVDYVIKHNPEVATDKVEICPNSIELHDMSISAEERAEIRAKYDVPLDKKVFIYGGNLGKPQGIPFMIECLKKCKEISEALFIVVGSGTEYRKIEAFVKEEKPQNVMLMEKLPKEDYDKLAAACDVGLIFLDHRFTIPNFPSRLLAYMQAKVPVLACTDPNTDVGKVITDGGFGWWCESNDTDKFCETVKIVSESELKSLGTRGYEYLQENYTVEHGCKMILEWMK